MDNSFQDIDTYPMPQIKKCIDLFNSGIFFDMKSPFREAAFIQLMINLNDALQFLSQHNKRITFSDHIKKKNTDKIMDITDLVNTLRNASCHNKSNNRNIENSILSFCTFYGKMPNAIKIGDIILGCDFEDDIVYAYGENLIYIHRHVRRLLELIPNECRSLLIKENNP